MMRKCFNRHLNNNHASPSKDNGMAWIQLSGTSSPGCGPLPHILENRMNWGTITGAGLSLASAAVWGSADFAGGIATRRANVFRVVACAHACGLIFMLLLALLAREPMAPPASLLWGGVAGVTGGFGIAALYKALSIGRMGVVAPVASVVTSILPVLVSIHSEGFPARVQLLGFGLALASIWFVARPDEQIDSRRGLGLAVLAGVMFGLFLVAGKQAGQHGILWPMAAARAASTLLMVTIVLALPSRDSRPLRPAALPILLSGVLDSSANALFL